MKPPRIFTILCLLFLVLASSAVAAPSAKHYALVYTWNKDIQRALDDRTKLARALSLRIDRELQIVGNGQVFGVIYPLNGTLAQARKLALNQSNKLKLAGFNPAGIEPAGNYNKRYHLLLTQNSDPNRLKKGYARITGKLPAADRDNLQVKKKRLPQLRPYLPPNSRAVAGINSKVQDFLREQRSKGKLQRQERTALLAYDLTNNTYLASINSQSSFQAASMIKPFVALAFFYQVDKGKLKYSSKHRQMMEQMIQHSDNQATNWFIRQLGGPAKCNTLVNKKYGRLFRQVRIREYIPPGGKSYKNSALPQDYVQFLKALWNRQLPYSQEMLRVMSLPGRDRIFWGTDVPSGTLVYNKTGTTAQLCGDMGILVTKSKNGKRVPYAIVGIVERSSAPKNYKQWMVHGGGVIREFSSLVYGEMKHKYNLL